MRTAALLGSIALLSLAGCSGSTEYLGQPGPPGTHGNPEEDGSAGSPTGGAAGMPVAEGPKGTAGEAEQAPPGVPAGVPTKTCPGRTDKSVVLTFDDGPSPYTDRLLDILAEKNAHAAFFLKAKKLDAEFTGYLENRMRVKRIQEAGHEICNHTFSHDGLVGPSDAGVRTEMLRAEELIADITGRRTRCMRPPFGDYNDHVLEILKDLDYQVIMWSLNTEDWRYASTDNLDELDPPKILEMIEQDTKSATGPLIHLQHDAEDSEPSIEMVPQVIDYLRAQGWNLITLSECLGGSIDVPK